MVSFYLISLVFFQAENERVEWSIDGVQREALVIGPRKKMDRHPLVFAFHGHGGNMRNVKKSFHLHELWPEAVVVYPQGLNTATQRDPMGLKPGWQNRLGIEKDRDLKFVDTMVENLSKKFSIDEKKIFATGHSNGAGFTYLLWRERSKVFTAFAPSAGGGAFPSKNLVPRPVFHLAGEKDEIVPFENQKKAMAMARTLNRCSESGKEWEKGCLLYPSTNGTPVVTYIHKGTHQFPATGPALIVKFFQEFGGK